MKTIRPENLASRLESLSPHPRVVAPGNFATPQTLLKVLDGAIPAYTLHMLNAQGEIPSRPGVTHETTFVGPGMRRSPTLMYYPCRLSLTPIILRSALPVDVLLLHTSTPRDGVVSMGLEVNILPAVLEAVRDRGGLVIAQVNPRMPHTYGDALVHVDDIDYAIEVDEPLMALEPPAPDEVAQAIAGRIYSRIPDGATLQLGIGGVPDAVLASLTGRRGLRIWSEMFSDGVLALHELGCFDTDVPLTASFVFGSQRLYEWLDGNRLVRMRRTEVTNNPGRISRTPSMISVNSALQVDLYGQANASRIKGRIYSGFGGSTDFIVGALHSPGGACVHRAALVAPARAGVHHRAAHRRPGHVLPALLRGHGVRIGADLRQRRAGAGPATDRARRAPRRSRGPVGGGQGPRPGVTPRVS